MGTGYSLIVDKHRLERTIIFYQKPICIYSCSNYNSLLPAHLSVTLSPSHTQPYPPVSLSLFPRNQEKAHRQRNTKSESNIKDIKQERTPSPMKKTNPLDQGKKEIRQKQTERSKARQDKSATARPSPTPAHISATNLTPPSKEYGPSLHHHHST